MTPALHPDQTVCGLRLTGTWGLAACCVVFVVVFVTGADLIDALLHQVAHGMFDVTGMSLFIQYPYNACGPI